MAAPASKRRRKAPETEKCSSKYPDILLFIVDTNIPRVRHRHLKTIARRKGIPVADKIGKNVTHIVAELETRDKVIEVLRKQLKGDHINDDTEVLSMSWFTTAMEENKIIDITDEYRLPREQKTMQEIKPKEEEFQSTKYACQRKTPLKHFNKKFTDALEVLEKHADLSGGGQDYSRALAFRRASAALKSLPRTVTSIEDVARLSDIGKHCRKVIQEILEDGHSTEVDDIQSNQRFQTMKLFTGMYGCGPATARKWYDMGYRSLKDITTSEKISLNKDQVKGLEHYDDLQIPVTRREAEALRGLIVDELNEITDGLSVVMTGGFIRGKDSGHDVDFLISHPTEGKECGVVSKLISRLTEKNLILHCSGQHNSFKEQTAKAPKHHKSSMMDQFEKCLTMLKLENSVVEMHCKAAATDGVKTMATNTSTSTDTDENKVCKDTTERDSEISDGRKDWRAIRVDFVVCPASQYAYALLGWTGSRMFNRSIRLYSDRELNMTLTSHGLYDKNNKRFLPASSEKEIFDHLKLTYLEPWDRNC